MDWRQIKDFPKSWEKLRDWLYIKNIDKPMNYNFRQSSKKVVCFTYNDLQNTINVPIDSRFLYDFFDYLPMFVLIKQFDAGEFYVEIWAFEINDETTTFEMEGHIELLYDSSVFNMFFDSRIEAETHAFVKAFEMLETRLNPSFSMS